MERNELPLGILIGPVLKETLTRVALVNTTTRVRAFGLDTGQVVYICLLNSVLILLLLGIRVSQFSLSLSEFKIKYV